jgi:hypothetical protein
MLKNMKKNLASLHSVQIILNDAGALNGGEVLLYGVS